jgi:heat-inducible transcriptional repressor
MERENLTNEIKKYIRKSLKEEIKARENLIRRAVRLLSQISNYTAMMIMSSYSQNILTHIQLLPVSQNRMVLIMVLDNGHVEHQVIETKQALTEKELAEITDMLRQVVCGKTVEQWRKISINRARSQWQGQILMLREILDIIEDALTVEFERKLFLSGTLNIMNQPEFKDVDKVRQVLSLLEEQRIMEEMMLKPDEGERQAISIRIGTENEYENLAACSLLTTTYHINGVVMGRLGLLGPTRMDYSRNISLLDFMSRYLSEEIATDK